MGFQCFDHAALEKIEAQLGTAFDIKFAFNKWTLGEALCKDVLGLTDAQLADPMLNLLEAIGFSPSAIDLANSFHPRMVARGGGAVGLEVNSFPLTSPAPRSRCPSTSWVAKVLPASRCATA